ncbi:MAG TPA: hypothetical protein VFP74_19860 [Pseudolabrys sp.]|nr:hypothetical protein [Pseudolabrys sp.]
MKLKLILAAACLAALPFSAQAQGVPAGAAYGFHEGNRMAGPVGAVVGTVVGGVTGGINAIVGVDPRAEEVRPEPVVYRHHTRHVRHHIRHHRRHH